MHILISLVPDDDGDHAMETDTEDIKDATIETNTHKDGYEKAMQDESDYIEEGDDSSVVENKDDDSGVVKVNDVMEESDDSSIVEYINENIVVPILQDIEARSQEYPLEVITEFLQRRSTYRVKVLI